MMFGIGLILKLLGAFAGYAAKKDDNATAIALESLRTQVAANAVKSDIIRAQLGHPVAWIPRFLIEGAAAIYFIAIVVDSIWQLPGDISELPVTEAALLATVFTGMFISDAVKSFTRNRK